MHFRNFQLTYVRMLSKNTELFSRRLLRGFIFEQYLDKICINASPSLIWEPLGIATEGVAIVRVIREVNGTINWVTNSQTRGLLHLEGTIVSEEYVQPIAGGIPYRFVGPLGNRDLGAGEESRLKEAPGVWQCQDANSAGLDPEIGRLRDLTAHPSLNFLPIAIVN